jgi:hypothetical protein
MACFGLSSALLSVDALLWLTQSTLRKFIVVQSVLTKSSLFRDSTSGLGTDPDDFEPLDGVQAAAIGHGFDLDCNAVPTPVQLNDYKGIVVLGGGLDSARIWEERQQVALNDAAERMTAPN